MRVPWRNRLPEHAIEEAQAAVCAAGEHLAQARARDREVRIVSSGLRRARERNGFSEGLAAMLRAEAGRGHGHAPNT